MFKLEKTEFVRMIDKIKEKVDSHQRTAEEIQEKMEGLASAACAELLKVKELKEVVENLRKDAPLSPGEDGVSANEDKTQSWKHALDQNIERLLAIKKLLESLLAPKKKPRARALALPASDETKKVLVVDDDPTTVKIIAHFLERENFTVSTSLSGAEGLKKAFQENPDLILLDIMMPDLNGFQFLSIFQKDELTARIPVIVLSSLAEEADVLRALETGAVDYILKPFSPQVLLAKIKKSLNFRQ